MIQELNSVEKINSFFENWSLKTESEKLEFIREVRSTGILTAVTPPKNCTDTCPVHAFQVAKPCGLSKCAYNIPSPHAKNCLFVALAESKNGRLNPDEIGQLLSLSMKEVNNHHNLAVKKIQCALIKESISLNRAPTFSYLPGHCVNCEMNIKDEMEMGGLSPELYLRNTQSFGWCSVKCKQGKPEHEFRIECEFKTEFKEVLRQASQLSSLRLSTKSATYNKIDLLLDLDLGTTEKTLV
jgi:hypothetical protein